MADPLSLLRHFNINKKPITERNSEIIFCVHSWPKSVKTNFLIWTREKEDTPKEYYTLECVLFLLKNVDLSHPMYVKQAASENIPVVTRPDRKELLAYLNGEIGSSSSIDKSIVIEAPTAVKSVNEGEEQQCVSETQKLAVTLQQTTVTTEHIRSLSDTLSVEKIVELKQKRLARKIYTIKKDDDVGITRYIISKERPGNTRQTILQNNRKNFAESLLPMLQRIKNKEEGSAELVQTQRPTAKRPRTQSMRYNRYDQELFHGKEETAEFQIDTAGSYHGMTLESLTALSQSKMSVPLPQTEKILPPARRNTKRPSKIPIIIIPALPTSLITMRNARDILQDLRYIKGASKAENELLVQRQRQGGAFALYRIIDNPMKLSDEDWNRVVAVFVQGQAWQFKNWPWGGDPVKIFSQIRAFHLKWEDKKLDANVAKWAVHVIQLSENKRHSDSANLLKFWEELENFIAKKHNFHF